jgi:hypothetical protein
MPELALDDVERHALAGELERVPVAQLVRRERLTHPRSDRCNSGRTAAREHRRPGCGRRLRRTLNNRFETQRRLPTNRG